MMTGPSRGHLSAPGPTPGTPQSARLQPRAIHSQPATSWGDRRPARFSKLCPNQRQVEELEELACSPWRQLRPRTLPREHGLTHHTRRLQGRTKSSRLRRTENGGTGWGRGGVQSHGESLIWAEKEERLPSTKPCHCRGRTSTTMAMTVLSSPRTGRFQRLFDETAVLTHPKIEHPHFRKMCRNSASK